jgi:AcrR family transcriptional regulator
MVMRENEPSAGPTAVAVPPAIALAWGVSDQPTRGPKPSLRLRRIVEAGIEIAVSDGLGAVAMAKVAEKLDVSTMALYRYVPSKADLLELMVDAALGPPPELPDGTPWRAGLRLWASTSRARYQQHPWSLAVPITGPPLGPNNVRWLEFGLASLRDTPLGDGEKLSTVLMLSAFVRGEQSITSGIVAHAAQTQRQPDDYGQLLERLIEPARFPELYRAIGAGSLRDEDPEDIGMDAEFAFGLERILDGVSSLIDNSSAAPDHFPP